MQVTQNAQDLIINFNSFSLEDYELFKRVKALPESHLEYDYANDAYEIRTHVRYANLLGIKDEKQAGNELLPFPEFLFEHQREIVKLALQAKRYAVWSDCGTGKTLIELELARQIVSITDGKVLIFTLKEIIPQMLDEARKFYGEELKIIRLETRAEMKQWCASADKTFQIAITNYEKMNPDEAGQIVYELKNLDGIILDESSRLKGGGGKQKWALIHSSKGIPYKFSLTATPAPNDVIEFASQASFLERMRSENEIIWTFFTRDKITQEWTVKRHAQSAFFEWMCVWSIYLRDARKYGWSASVELPPEPIIIKHEISITAAQAENALVFNTNTFGQPSLFATQAQGIVGRSKLSQIAKGFVYEKHGTKTLPRRIESEKPRFVAELIEKESKENQVLVWTIFDEESEIIAEHLGERAEIRADLEKRLKYAKSEYYKTEAQMFAEIPSGEIDPKHKATIKAAAVRKKEFEYYLKAFGDEIKKLDAQLADLELESEIADLENKTIGGELVEGKDFAILSGKQKDGERAEIIEKFRKGEITVLISKAKLLGYGMNFQNVGSMIFSGWDDSFENFYQAVRRAVRYGQTKQVRVHLPFIPELELAQLDNVLRKETQFVEMIERQESAYIEAMKRIKIL